MRLSTSLLLLASVALSACARHGRPLSPSPSGQAAAPAAPARLPPPSPVAAPPPAPAHSAAEHAAVDEAVQAAYDALAAHGLTEETLASFRRALGGDPPAAEPVIAMRLTGALSDDGEALIVQVHGRSMATFLADPKTGKLRGRVRGGDLLHDALGRQASPRFFSGTHLVPFREHALGKIEADTLVVRDAITGEVALRTPLSIPCAPAQTAGRVAYVTREVHTPRVHVWDAKTRGEIDAFDAPGEPRWEGCLRMPDPSLVGVAWAGYDVPRAFFLRSVAQKTDLAQVAGGAYGPVTALSPGGRYLAVGLKPDQRTDRHPPPGKTLLFDTKTGATIATSDACTSPGGLAFDARGETLAVGDLVDACLLAVPSLKLVRRTAPLRPPFAAGPWKITQTIARLASFGDRALLASTEDGLFAVYELPSGKLVWKGEGGSWAGVEGAGTSAIAHGFAFTDEGDHKVMDRHVRVTAALRVTETRSRADAASIARDAWRLTTPEPIRGALERVASQSCHSRGALVPREVCGAPLP